MTEHQFEKLNRGKELTKITVKIDDDPNSDQIEFLIDENLLVKDLKEYLLGYKVENEYFI